MRATATVRVNKPARRQAKQAKGKRENRYVVKVMSVKRKGGQFLKSARTRGCTSPFNWAIIKLI